MILPALRPSRAMFGGGVGMGGEILNIIKNCTCVSGGEIRFSVFFFLLYGTPANIFRKPATGGMASQHLRTLERGVAQKEGFLRFLFTA